MNPSIMNAHDAFLLSILDDKKNAPPSISPLMNNSSKNGPIIMYDKREKMFFAPASIRSIPAANRNIDNTTNIVIVGIMNVFIMLW